MYYIKDDKRTKKSVMFITNAFLSCLEEKEFTRITVSDIQRKADISRATFYRIFDTVDDVMIYIIDKHFEENFSQIKLIQMEELIPYCLDIVSQSRSLISNIAKCGRIDILTNSCSKNLKKYSEIIASKTGLLTTHIEYYLSSFSAFLAANLLVWQQNGQKESIEELIEIIKEELSILTKNLPASK